MKKIVLLALLCAMSVSLVACKQEKPKEEPIPTPDIVQKKEDIDIEDYQAEVPNSNDSIDIDNDEKEEQQKLVVEKPKEEPLQEDQPEKIQAEEVKEIKEQKAVKKEPIKEQETVPQQEKPIEQESLPAPKPVATQPNDTQLNYDEKRAIWVSFLDFNSILKNKTESQFTQNIRDTFDNIVNYKMNTVIAQVRPYADALYNSKYFPWSHTITGTEGKDPNFDPLKIMVNEAHKRGLKIEAWVNPYRIRSSGSISSLSDDNIAKKWANEQNGAVKTFNSGIYFSPSSEDAQQLIIDGVKEIVENYDVDGIHFDDYFYPTTDEKFDATEYKDYTRNGGDKSLSDWRRSNVNTLIHDVYTAIKSINSKVQFGISPQGSITNNYNKLYSDVKKWASQEGYIDYIMPQVYYGFDNGTCPFRETVRQWNSFTCKSVELQIGLSPYKLGQVDKFAGEGKNEWIGTADILQRMVLEARDNSNYTGFALFRYDNVFNPASSVEKQVDKEIDNLKDILK